MQLNAYMLVWATIDIFIVLFFDPQTIARVVDALWNFEQKYVGMAGWHTYTQFHFYQPECRLLDSKFYAHSLTLAKLLIRKMAAIESKIRY